MARGEARRRPKPVSCAWQAAGRLEHHPPADLDGVVGEPLVEPAQQRDVDRGADAALPLAVDQHREQVTVLGCRRRRPSRAIAPPSRRRADSSTSCAVLASWTATSAISVNDPRTSSGNALLGMPQPGDVGDMHGQRAHPLDIGADVQRADDLPQVAGHRLLQRQQPHRASSAARHLSAMWLMVGDDLFGKRQIGLQQGRVTRAPSRPRPGRTSRPLGPQCRQITVRGTPYRIVPMTIPVIRAAFNQPS